MIDRDRLSPTLADAALHGRLAVFCGAGLSKGAPSYLPDWRSLNQFVLDEARAAALWALPDLSRSSAAEVESLSLAELPVESFSDQLVTLTAGRTWFELLRLLDSEQANTGHRALAGLAGAGTLAAIASTNFDTLIERAFRERGVPLDVFARPADYARAPAALPLYKIHGSAGDDASIVDTVTQKIGGLDRAVTARLAELAGEQHLLFVGYSGADLAVADDYLELFAALAAGPGMSWLVPPGVEPSAAVRRLVAAAGVRGSFVEGSLPEFFSALGAEVEGAREEADAAAQAEADAAAQAEADERARAAIRSWIADDEISALGCALFLRRLLRGLGRFEAAREIRDAVAADPELGGDSIALQSVPAMSSLFFLGLAFFEDGEFERARFWLRRSRAFDRGVGEFFAANALELQPDVVASRDQTEAVREFDLALCDWHLGELDDPEGTLDRVLALAEASGQQTTRAGVHQLRATIASAAGESADVVLTHLHRARRAAEDAGAAQNLLEIESEAARRYLHVGEFDCALASLDRADGYAELLGDLARGIERRRLRALVSLGRGEVVEAAATLEDLIALTESLDAYVAHGLRWDFCVHLSFHQPLRERVVEHLSVLDAAERAAADAPPGTWRSLPTRGQLDQFRAAVENDALPSRPLLVIPRLAELGEDVRAHIERAEFERDLVNLAGAFERLCIAYADGDARERFPDRLTDLAYAQDVAARLAAGGEPDPVSLMWLGLAASDGDPVAAVDYYRRALALEPDPGLLASLRQNLAVALGKLGERVEALDLLVDVLEYYRSVRDDAAYARAALALADELRSMGETDRARAIARKGAAAAASAGDAELETLLGSFAPPEVDVDAVLGLADALADAGVVDATFATLEAVDDAPASLEQLGRADGSRGRALQTAGRHAEAAPYFAQARERFERAGADDLAARAAAHLASSLRAGGDLDRAEEVARDALARPSSPAERADLSLTLANTLLGRLQEGVDSEDTQARLLGETIELLTTASRLSTDETRGLALAQRAQLHALLGDAGAAAVDAAEALGSLRASGSVHLGQLEPELSRLSEAGVGSSSPDSAVDRRS